MFFETKNLDNKKVFDVISSDFRYAKALDSFGIDFYNKYDFTIKEICREKGLSVSSVHGYRLAMDESFDLDFNTLKSSPLNLVNCLLSSSLRICGRRISFKDKLPEFPKNLISLSSCKFPEIALSVEAVAF